MFFLGFKLLSTTSDVIVFSYNRPMQLYALLESIELYVTNVDSISIIYRASSKQFEKGYQAVKNRFSNCFFHKQSDNPYADFKPLTMSLIQKGKSDYVMFAVDDNIVKDAVDCRYCISLLEKTGAYGFYLRLGKNLSYCLPCKSAQTVPPLALVQDDVYSWIFNQAQLDWAYPNTVDMTLYRKKDVLADLSCISFSYPNPMEGRWSQMANKVAGRRGLCFQFSKILNVPLNRVQPDYHSQSMEIDPKILLDTFLNGFKLDIQAFKKLNNISAHIEVEPSFCTR